MRKFRFAPDPAARLTCREQVLLPVVISLEEAQQWVNFVVHEPRVLPDDCRVAETSVRPEQPPGRPDGLQATDIGQTPWSDANPCSARTVIHGRGRALRIKQFLYDWAPPAAWIAPLWDTPWLVPVVCRKRVGWVGKDYRESLGACAQLQRTQIELSVLEGEFQPSELAAMLRGMAPADGPAAALVRRAPFHRLNYWVRYRMVPYRVPYGLWKYPHRRPYDTARRLSRAGLLTQKQVRVLLPPLSEFTLDSALHISHPGLEHQEVEIVLHRRREPDGSLWISCMREGSLAQLPVPPEPESQAAAMREEQKARGTSVWLASLTREHGAHEAFWSEAGHRYAVWSAPGATFTAARFLEMLEGMAPP